MKKSTQNILIGAAVLGVGVVAYKKWQAKKAATQTLTAQANLAAAQPGVMARMASPEDDYEEFEVVDDWYGPGIVGGWGRGGWGGGRHHGGGHHHHGGGHHRGGGRHH